MSPAAISSLSGEAIVLSPSTSTQHASSGPYSAASSERLWRARTLMTNRAGRGADDRLIATAAASEAKSRTGAFFLITVFVLLASSPGIRSWNYTLTAKQWRLPTSTATSCRTSRRRSPSTVHVGHFASNGRSFRAGQYLRPGERLYLPTQRRYREPRHAGDLLVDRRARARSSDHTGGRHSGAVEGLAGTGQGHRDRPGHCDRDNSLVQRAGRRPYGVRPASTCSHGRPRSQSRKPISTRRPPNCKCSISRRPIKAW